MAPISVLYLVNPSWAGLGLWLVVPDGNPKTPVAPPVEENISASSTPALSKFTIVQSNVDLATAAATAGAAVKGISGYDSNNFSVSSGFVSLKKFSASIGDGSNTSYTVNHALGSRDVIVQLFDNSSYDTVIADVVRTDINNVTISFTVAPSTNDIRVLIQKI